MYRVKIAGKSERGAFLALPSRIYKKNEIMQKRSDEEALLSGTHTLSKYFSFTPFLCYLGKKVVARCAVTIYPDKEEGYLGFFDCIDDTEAARCITEAAESFARERGIKKLVGPVDASFWIGYRMKADHFDKERYFGEPYGKDYYPRLWRECGFEVSGVYVSNIYKELSKDDVCDERYARRLRHFERSGYVISSAKKEEWDKAFSEFYSLIIRLYSDFPVFSHVTEEEFGEMFGSMKFILDYSMVKFGYKDGKMVGFLIGIPDYRNKLYGSLGLGKLLYILKKRKKCDNYILLYMGVVPESLGFGSALSLSAFNELCEKNASSIGALIKKGKDSEKYIEDIIVGKREYLLFEKAVTG